jgi:hypothetical protein
MPSQRFWVSLYDALKLAQYWRGSPGNSEERARMMRALGAEVVLVDQLAGSLPGQVSGADLELVEQASGLHHRPHQWACVDAWCVLYGGEFVSAV